MIHQNNLVKTSAVITGVGGYLPSGGELIKI